ncbi:MAG: YybH family protein [Candidatus Binataceae bacterium]
MKKSGWLVGTLTVAMLCALVLPVRAAENAKAEKSKTQITDFEHNCIKAQTTSQAMACFDPNDVAIYDFEPPLDYSGKAAVSKDLANFFDNAKDIKGHFMQLQVVSDGTLGIANSIQHFTWTGKDGKPMAATFRVTDCLHNVDGHWKIFHSHVSVPVDPATGKAVMDAKM